MLIFVPSLGVVEETGEPVGEVAKMFICTVKYVIISDCSSCDYIEIEKKFEPKVKEKRPRR